MGTPSSAGEDERTHTQLETIGTPHEPLGLTRPLSVPPLLNRRINAEDAFQNFRPGPGRISAYLAPGGPNTRMDSHIYPGYLVPPNYDSLLGKLIVWAPDRDQAITRMDRALGDTIITGVPTTIPYHKLILDLMDGGIELYDVVSDPGETQDISSAEPRLTYELEQELRSWMQSVGTNPQDYLGVDQKPIEIF